MRQTHSAITLIEIMISMLIVSFILVAAFQTLSYVGIAKVKLIEKSQIEKEAFFASERLIDLIKKGGSIDYEEYWNRRAIGNTSFSGGYFSQPSGFGNFGRLGVVGTSSFGENFYYCLSGNTAPMGNNGCLTNFNQTTLVASSQDYTGEQQRYGQYRLQYIDHNSDANGDFGDANGDLNFIGDDDDLFLGRGPDAFVLGSDVGELYLMNTSGNERTYFRWKIELDAEAPTGATCSSGSGKTMTGSGCLGTIQILKLQGEDTVGNGVIDTWYIDPEYITDGSLIIAGSVDMNPYWQNIFSNRIHVSRAEFYLYPTQDGNYAWADPRPDLQVAPYLQLGLTLEPSWRERRRIRGEVPVVNIATTISLSQVDIF